MDVEIIEVYPDTIERAKGFCKGTLHMYIADLDLDIRGAFFFYKAGNCFVRMPGKKGYDQDTDSWVRYPCVGFTNREKTKKLLEVASQLAKVYIEENVLKRE